MITAAAIIFSAGWFAHALCVRWRRHFPPRPGLSLAVQKNLRRTRAPWIN